MLIRHALTLGLLATAATFALSPAHAADAALRDPQTGKNCVIFFSAEKTTTGRTRMNYRNICPNVFAIRIQTNEGVREKTIEAGSVKKPSMAYVTCNVDDRCESATWIYE